MTVAIIISAIVFAILSGFSKAVCDLSEEGKLKFKPSNYWIKALSSIRKYEYKNKLIAYLMKTVLVMFTDGWHLFQFVLTVMLLVCGYFIGRLSAANSEYYTFGLLVVYGIRTATFHIFHDSTNWIKKK